MANPNGTNFAGGSFIFDTEDGLVVYWNGSSNTAIIGKDNSASGAVYKGLALLGTHLLAANFNSGKVDVYDSNYNLTSLGGTFTNPNLPVGYAPHGIHVIVTRSTSPTRCRILPSMMLGLGLALGRWISSIATATM